MMMKLQQKIGAGITAQEMGWVRWHGAAGDAGRWDLWHHLAGANEEAGNQSNRADGVQFLEEPTGPLKHRGTRFCSLPSFLPSFLRSLSVPVDKFTLVTNPVFDICSAWCLSWPNANFPRKRRRRVKASAFEPTQHYQVRKCLNLSSLRSRRAPVVLRCSFHFSPAPPTGSNLEHCPPFN